MFEEDLDKNGVESNEKAEIKTPESLALGEAYEATV